MYTFSSRTPGSRAPVCLCNVLHSVRQHLVHPGNLAGNTHIDCPLANLHDQPTEDFGVDFGNDLELLSLRVLGFLYGGLEALLEVAWEFLCYKSALSEGNS